MGDSGRNAQAAFLDAMKDQSLDRAVEVLKGIHDGKEALGRVARSVEASGSPLAAFIPKVEDARRASDLLFDLARFQVDTLDRLFGLRDKHTRRLGERLGDLLGFPLGDNQGEVLDVVIPVRAVEGDRLERPMDGESTRYCEIHRRFRVKNLTSSEWPAGSASTPVELSWSRNPNISDEALRVDVLRDPVAVGTEAVLPLRVRVRWIPGSLDKMNTAGVASGRYELRGAGSRLEKVIELALRFDLASGRARPMSDEGPELEVREEDALLSALRQAQRLILRYPVAAQALFAAAVAEGRAYGETPEGAALRERLKGSELIRRGRVVWEVGTLNVLEEEPATVLPSKVMDALAKAATVPDLEPMLTRLFRVRRGDDAT